MVAGVTDPVVRVPRGTGLNGSRILTGVAAVAGPAGPSVRIYVEALAFHGFVHLVVLSRIPGTGSGHRYMPVPATVGLVAGWLLLLVMPMVSVAAVAGRGAGCGCRGILLGADHRR